MQTPRPTIDMITGRADVTVPVIVSAVDWKEDVNTEDMSVPPDPVSAAKLESAAMQEIPAAAVNILARALAFFKPSLVFFKNSFFISLPP